MLTVIALAAIATGTGTLTGLHRAFGYVALLLLAIAGILFLAQIVPE